MYKKNILVLLCIILTSLSCSRNEDSFEDSPAQRTAKHLYDLRKELTEAPYGWRMIYFSKTDSLLFADKDAIIETMGDYLSLYGYGGHYFQVKFRENGTLQMLADYNQKSVTQPQESLFEVKQNSFTQLSFVTYNYLHQLVNEKFVGASDFLYVGKDFRKNLIFKTTNSAEVAREYIILEKILTQADWQGSNNIKSNIQLAFENRLFFERMKNPQLRIQKSGKVYFESDVQIKTNSPLPSYIRFLEEIKEKRYYLFRFNKKPDLVYPQTPKESTGLGSGYVGTDKGLTFRAGIRYNSTYIFYDFKRDGDKFVCELVKVYDPIRRKYMYESKHLFPEGETTFFTAEIFDKN